MITHGLYADASDARGTPDQWFTADQLQGTSETTVEFDGIEW